MRTAAKNFIQSASAFFWAFLPKIQWDLLGSETKISYSFVRLQASSISFRCWVCRSTQPRLFSSIFRKLRKRSSRSWISLRILQISSSSRSPSSTRDPSSRFFSARLSFTRRRSFSRKFTRTARSLRSRTNSLVRVAMLFTATSRPPSCPKSAISRRSFPSTLAALRVRTSSLVWQASSSRLAWWESICLRMYLSLACMSTMRACRSRGFTVPASPTIWRQSRCRFASSSTRNTNSSRETLPSLFSSSTSSTRSITSLASPNSLSLEWISAVESTPSPLESIMLKISSTVLSSGKAWTNFSMGESSERSSQTGSCLWSVLESASYSNFSFSLIFLLRVSMLFSALLMSWFFSRLKRLQSTISCLICLITNTSSSRSSFCFSFFSRSTWYLRSSIRACFLASPFGYLGRFSLSFFSFCRFCSSIFFWIIFSFCARYFFMSMYLKSVRLSGIFTSSGSSSIFTVEAGFFLAFCSSKMRLFFSFRYYYFCLASSYSLRRASSSFFCRSSFLRWIYRLPSSMSFSRRAISDSESFSRLLSSPFAFYCLAAALASGFLAEPGFELAQASLGFLFSLGFALGTSLLVCDFMFDLILRMAPSLSLELSMNSDCASDRSSSFLNWKSLPLPICSLTSSMFSEAISDSTSGSSSILYSSCSSSSSAISSFISSSSGYSSTGFSSNSSLYSSWASSSESLASSSISAWVSLFILTMIIAHASGGGSEAIIVSYYPVMERDPRPGKLDPIPATLGPFEGSRYSKDSQLSKFRLSHASDRLHRTEPSVENIREQLPKKPSKNRTEFSEEYMSLVNKLRVNLSRQLQKKARVEVFQERQYLFNNENRQKTPFLTKERPHAHQHFPRESLKISNLKKRSFTTFSKQTELAGPRTFRNYDNGLLEESFDGKSEEGLRKEKSSYLPLMSAFQRGRYALNDVIKEVTEQNSPEKPKKEKKRPPKPNSKKPKERVTLIFKSGEHVHANAAEHSLEQDLKELNLDYPKIDELCFHIEILIDILERMNASDNSEENPDKLIKLLKDYVLGNKKSLASPNRLLVDDISHLDRIFKEERSQKQLRTLVFYERILVVACIDLLATRALARHQHHVNTILHSLLGTYLYLLYLRSQAKAALPAYAQGCLAAFHAKTSEHNIHVKRELETTVFFVSKKVFPLLKANPGLFRQIRVLVGEFESRSVTINRAFYELLRLFAVYLNNHEGLLEKHYQAMKTFATCPSPYLTKPPAQRYTLVLDLDETLIHSHRDKHRLEIFMRPFLKEFLEVMARHYELVVFTSSMPDYSEEIIAQLPHVAHRLYRYHTTRLRHRHIKDLSRLGRPLEAVVMVDNEEENFVLQKENGIRIAEWTGDDPHDQELNILGLFLNELASKAVSDVREHLASYREFRANHQ